MKTNKKDNNKRILKNTLMLYIRMFFIMALSLFTSRVILKALGVQDYGLYNVVGGIVAMMGLVKGVMAGATSRFLNFALGKDDEELARKSFNVSLVIYYILALVFILIAETVGLWFLNTQLHLEYDVPKNISDVVAARPYISDLITGNMIDRRFAANCVYQFTILSAVNQLIAAPYNAAIIAHEKMNIFAYISILEVVLKLIIVYILFISPYDRLILYGLLMLVCDLIIREMYRIYCRRKYKECKFKFYKDKSAYKEILSYSSWNLFGSVAAMIKGHGLNVLLGMFFNPSVNASRGLSYQINNAINQFVNNFYTAVRPQITKYYAKNELENMFELVCRSAKLALYLFIFFTIPIYIEAPYVIQLWLNQQPQYVVEFIRLILIISALDCIQQPLKTTAQATGKIARYEMTLGILTLLNLPISFILLKYYNMPPVTVFYVSLVISTSCFFARLILLRGMVGFPVMRYIKAVVFRGSLVILIASVIPVSMHFFMEPSVITSVSVIFVSLATTVLSVMFIGVNASERDFIYGIIKKKLNKKK